MKKAFAFSGSLLSFALYLIGGNGAYGSFGYFVVDAWDAVKSIFFAALSIGVGLFEILAAVAVFIVGCLTGSAALIYSAVYYILIAMGDALAGLLSLISYDPDSDYPMY